MLVITSIRFVSCFLLIQMFFDAGSPSRWTINLLTLDCDRGNILYCFIEESNVCQCGTLFLTLEIKHEIPEKFIINLCKIPIGNNCCMPY